MAPTIESAKKNRLRHWREQAKLSRKELADRVNTSPGQIQKLEMGERRLTVEWLERLAAALGCEPADLLPPIERTREQSAAVHHRERLEASAIVDMGVMKVVQFAGEQYWPIGVFDVRVAAGAGAINHQPEIPIYYSFFRSDWIRRITTAKPQDLAVVRVSGDSMWDTLHDGDHILIDRTKKTVGVDAIYVIRIDDELQIKRISKHPATRLLTIKSDNPAYPTYSEIQPESIDVVGKAIWLGRNLGG